MIGEPVLELGSTGPHIVSTLYWMLREMIDALDGVETGQSEASGMAELTQREARWEEHRSRFKHD